MIQIQIATSLTTQGVGDIRWVLLEPSDPAEPVDVGAVTVPASVSEHVPPEPSAPAAGPGPSGSPRRWLRALAIAVVVAAAWWMASSLSGPAVVEAQNTTSVEVKR